MGIDIASLQQVNGKGAWCISDNQTCVRNNFLFYGKWTSRLWKMVRLVFFDCSDSYPRNLLNTTIPDSCLVCWEKRCDSLLHWNWSYPPRMLDHPLLLPVLITSTKNTTSNNFWVSCSPTINFISWWGSKKKRQRRDRWWAYHTVHPLTHNRSFIDHRGLLLLHDWAARKWEGL